MPVISTLEKLSPVLALIQHLMLICHFSNGELRQKNEVTVV